jgi:chromosomal replication initiator protein
VDDLQFLEGKEHTQEEFFHTFNDLRDAGAQVVVSSDRQPALLTGMDARLRSRLAAGLTADVHPPSFDTRLAIVRARAQREGLNIGRTVLELIASREVPNVRELEGGFNRVVAFAQLSPGAPFSEDLARRALTPFAPAHAISPPSPDRVIDAVCQRFGVTLQDLASKKRDRQTTYARHVLMYLLREVSHQPFTDIGRILGGRDHSTVIHAIHRISSELSTLADTREDVESLASGVTGVA